ncbi:MAG: YceI family protein [Actinoallomurus sp.]
MSVTAAELGLTAGTWNIDPAHSEVTFSIRHLMSKVRGSFTEFSGSVEIAEDILASTVIAEIQLNSIDTRNADRDAHIRSKDILAVEDHPTMKFETKGVRIEGDKNLVDGELTIKGISRPITLDVEFNGIGEDPWGGTRAGFTATGSLSRKDYGIEFNVPLSGDKALLGDKVDIQLEVQAVRV